MEGVFELSKMAGTITKSVNRLHPPTRMRRAGALVLSAEYSAKTERATILETAGYWRSLRLPTDPDVDVGVGAGNGRIALENRTSD